MEQREELTRREILKAAYAAPVIATFAVSPAFAQGGSGSEEGGSRNPQQPPVQQQ